MDLLIYVDIDHTGDKLTGCSKSRFMVYMNTALTKLYSKRQLTIETSVFGAEFLG